MIVPRVERIPLLTEKDLEPGAEVHRRRITRHSDIAEITGAVARRDVHAPAQCDREMREISAHADAFLVTFRRRAVASRMMVTKLEPVMDVIANSLHPLPTALKATELCPGKITQLLGIAVAAAEQIDQRLIRQLVDLQLLGLGSRRRACHCGR